MITFRLFKKDQISHSFQRNFWRSLICCVLNIYLVFLWDSGMLCLRRKAIVMASADPAIEKRILLTSSLVPHSDPNLRLTGLFLYSVVWHSFALWKPICFPLPTEPLPLVFSEENILNRCNAKECIEVIHVWGTLSHPMGISCYHTAYHHIKTLMVFYIIIMYHIVSSHHIILSFILSYKDYGKRRWT